MFLTHRNLARVSAGALILIAFAPCRAASPYVDALSAGIRAVQAGDPARAAISFTRAVRANPNHPAGWNAWGLLLAATGDTTQARAAFRRAQGIAPIDPRAETGLWLADALDGTRNEAGLDSLAARKVPGSASVRAYLDALDGKEHRGPPPSGDPLDEAVAAFRGQGDWGKVAITALGGHRRVFLATFNRQRPIDRGWSSRPSLSPPALTPKRTVSGSTVITADFAPAAEMASFLVNDETVSVTNARPLAWRWDTTAWPNGVYVVSAVAQLPNGRKTSRTEVVRVANGNAPEARAPGGIEAAENALQDLLIPLPDPRYANVIEARRWETEGDIVGARETLMDIAAVSPNYPGVIEGLERLAPKDPPIAVYRGPATLKRIALTFDDGPVPHRTPALLDLLKTINVRATFFVVGKQAVAHPDILLRMSVEKHEIAGHTDSHRNLTRLSRVEVLRELAATRRAIGRITGHNTFHFRPPGGNINAGVSSAAALLGLTPVMWTYNAGVTEGMPVEEMVPQYVKAARPGAIYLVHNGTDKIQQALPQVVTELRRQGYEFVTLSELLRGASPPSP